MILLEAQFSRHLTPSQVRYRAALHPDPPKRLDPVMIFATDAQEGKCTGWNEIRTKGAEKQSSKRKVPPDYHQTVSRLFTVR